MRSPECVSRREDVTYDVVGVTKFVKIRSMSHKKRCPKRLFRGKCLRNGGK